MHETTLYTKIPSKPFNKKLRAKAVGYGKNCPSHMQDNGKPPNLWLKK
jgi:hypothetical protein